MQISCATNPLDGPLVTVNVAVSDETGAPLEGAIVSGGFQSKDTGTPAAIDQSNKLGKASIRGHAPLVSINLVVNKDRYYISKFNRIGTTERYLAELAPRTRSRNVTLRQIRNPRSLIAKRVHELPIPVENEWVGYDLELGDWVEPQGKGQRADFLLRYKKEFLGYNISKEGLEKVRKREAKDGNEWTVEMERFFYGNWSGQLKISFPGEKEGILLVTMEDGYLWESEMHMPHRAREKGYEPEITFEGFMPPKIKELRKGYFLRVRVKERNDQILEANYAKINEEIQFDPRGKISFTYYFNPDVNDRNLEFDPEENLLEIPDSDVPVRLP
ncbi:MAG: hypothetical protein ACON46_00235 [Coraliomargaritaceae bacterium]